MRRIEVAAIAATLVDKAMLLDHVGGVYGGTRRPARFMCLLLKMLQIQPEMDIVVALLQSDLKYVRILVGLLCLACIDFDHSQCDFVIS